MNIDLLFALTGIVVLALTTIAWFSRARRVAIPDNRAPFLLGWGGGVALGAMVFALPSSGWFGSVMGGISMLGGLFFLGLYALRGQKAGDSISVGDKIPAFQAIDDQGQSFSSDSISGSPSLIKFFRGHW